MSDVPANKKLNRREFLTYMMAGSVGFLGIQATRIALWYALPSEYEQNIFVIKTLPYTLAHFTPAIITSDTTKIQMRFSLTYSNGGLAAFHKECLSRGCRYAWIGNNGRFECACSGSKFKLDGTYIEGPSPRNPDRFALKVITKTVL